MIMTAKEWWKAKHDARKVPVSRVIPGLGRVLITDKANGNVGDVVVDTFVVGQDVYTVAYRYQ